MDFRKAEIEYINAVKFDTSGTFTFKDHQIGNNAIASLTEITGSSGINEIDINVYSTSNQINKLSLAQFTFKNWSGDDKVYLYGSDDADILQAASVGTYLNGGGSDDVIYGGAGNDVIVGGKGGDLLYGLGGNDTFVFSPGDRESWEKIDGGGGVNEVAGQGNINFGGQNGNLVSIQDIHFLSSGTFTFDSSNWIFQFQNIIGSSGKDHLILDNSPYSLDVSKLAFSNWSSSDVIELRSYRGVVGTKFDDAIFGSGVLNGGDGNDVIRGSGELIGGHGIDILYGDTGNDILVGDDAGDKLYGGGGYDTFELKVSGVKLVSGSGKIIFDYNTTIDPSYLERGFGDFVIGSGATKISFNMSGIRPSAFTGPTASVTGNDKDNLVTYTNDLGSVLFTGYEGRDTISVTNAKSGGSLYFSDFTTGEDKIAVSDVKGIADYFSLQDTSIGNGIYLERYGTARQWDVVKHDVSSHLQDGQTFFDVHNLQLFTITSGGDYMSDSDFII